MSVNKISAAVPQDAENSVIQKVKEVRELLPFLIDLPKDERLRMSRLSRRYVDFVDRGLLHAKAHPHYMPPFLSIDEFSKDVELKNCLHRILAEVDSLSERLRDTVLQVESEAYTSARVFYKSVKAAAKEGAEDAERIAKDLAYHYKKRSSKQEGEEEQPEPEQG